MFYSFYCRTISQ